MRSINDGYGVEPCDAGAGTRGCLRRARKEKKHFERVAGIEERTIEDDSISRIGDVDIYW